MQKRVKELFKTRLIHNYQLWPDFNILQIKNQSFHKRSFRDTSATAVVLEIHKN